MLTELMHADGFLGTNGNLAADATLLLSILVLITFTVGFVLARRGQYTAHGRVQTLGAIVNLILVLWMMILPFRDFVVVEGGAVPRPRPSYFYLVTTLHAVAGFTALIFGWFVVLRGHNIMIPALRFENYKPYMRVAYGLYFLATLLGITVYLTWFVFVPNPPLFK